MGSGRPLVATKWAHIRDVKRSLSDVLEDALGSNHRRATDVRIEQLQETLRPFFDALPKNRHGLLGHSAVRYALHRHFVHKHAMYVKGLEPAGQSWNSSSPTDILEDRVPAYVQHVFEERLHAGFDLKELSLLAATLEHFIHNESVERLKVAYQLSGHVIDATISVTITPEQLEHVMNVYMALYVSGWEMASKAQADFSMQNMQKIYPDWLETQAFVREVAERVLEGGSRTELIGFPTATKVVESINDQWGRHQDKQCQSMSKTLIAKEEKGTGRITLANFREAGWQFKESEDYLLELGALDINPKSGSPSVIIPNYVTSATNCLSSSDLYSVCCIDQCEELLGHLERRIAAPDATPERIVELVSALPSPTIGVPRHLSASLVQHLNEIGQGNGGRVPLHGRLFAQWMHHAYPRECPFPHKSGTTKLTTADEWLKEVSSSLDVHVKVKDLVDGDIEETLPWLADEELLVPRPSLAHELWVIGRALVFIAALSSAIFSLGYVGGIVRNARSRKALV